jgi:hypothetical protein
LGSAFLEAVAFVVSVEVDPSPLLAGSAVVPSGVFEAGFEE